jgi:hypothetical protein
LGCVFTAHILFEMVLLSPAVLCCCPLIKILEHLIASFSSPTKNRIVGAAARIDPSSRLFVSTTAIVGTLAFASAFAVSGNALWWAGTMLHLPWPLALPLAVDLPLVAFALSALARRSRGQGTKSSMAWLLMFSLVSIAINIWHSLSLGAVGVDLIGSIFISAVIPIAILSTSEQLLSVLVAPPATNDIERLQREARASDKTASTIGASTVKPRKGSAEHADRIATIRDRQAILGGVSNASLQREGFSMSEINQAAGS